MGGFLAGHTTAEEIFRHLQDEKKTGELLPLNREFYLLAERGISGATGSAEALQEAENTKRLIRTLKEKRLQKLLIYLAYNKPLPSQVPTEEEDLYRQIQLILNKTSPQQDKNKKIRVLANIPEVITTKGNKIGPFKQGQVIEASNEDDIEFIINNKLGEITNQ